MPSDPFCDRVHHHICPKFKGPAQIRRAEGVIHHQRDVRVVRNLCHRGDIQNVVKRIADRLGINRLGGRCDRLGKVLGIIRINKMGLDPHPTKGVVKLRVGSAIKRACSHQFIAGLQKGKQRYHLCGHARSDHQPRPAAFKRREPLLQHGIGRIHHPRIHIAEGLKVEKTRGMVRAVEYIGRGLVDRCRTRPRSCVRHLARVQTERFESEFAVSHSNLPKLNLSFSRRAIWGVWPR